MKFSLSVAVLALVASQAMAVVPVPVKECTKTVVVQPTDIGCDAFAIANGITFAQLLKWNLKLRTDCANLDVGAPLCVSITAGGGGNSTQTGTVTGTATGKPAASVTLHTTTAAATTTSVPTSAPITSKPSGANGNRASMVLGAAGVLLSVVYML
ncbi:hypothetical protein BC939DRAFT_472548 [Gamsiella multidivaricata]|uniref:uncharacterized protein n=1 Tax=Gamsiella multidivaricata TaxID=101098 RepID=UPI0022211FEA|nr:uncharacterized protein BC939DRAFT_472548 [Gamsiella multidivaricata]KAG0363809.1 hypothetical protein BGZ54_008011 [Gamsiella multidivaricata]KAI7832306.1 hypothetical protein BC939DRAFT_472548 [Gamsiella multidivaricata]